MDSHKVVTHQGQSREGESPLLDRRKDSFSCTRPPLLVVMASRGWSVAGDTCPPRKQAMSLTKLTQATQDRINALCDRFNDKKGWHISEIVAEYAADALVTPEHLLVGLKGKQNVGTAYAAWYVHKSGVDAKAMNITFIANNYSAIQVQTTPEAMSAELSRVSALAIDLKKSLVMAEALAGTAAVNAYQSLSDEFDKVAKTIIVPSNAADALVMTLRVKMANLEALYKASLPAKVQEKETIKS